MTDLNPSVHIERTERTNPMTDHLTDARTCVTFASKAHVAADAISWLIKTCKQIIAHLESQQTTAPQDDDEPWTPDAEDVEFCLDYLEAQNISREVTSADLTASQPEPEPLGGGDFTDWMADRLADPEVRAGYLAAHAREVREQVARELHYEAKAMTRFSAPSHA